jgi:hypothetical protein
VTTSLQRILYVDFLGALTTALVMIGAAAPLEAQLGLPATLLRAAGLALLPFVGFVLLTARSSGAVHRPRVYAIMGFNLFWLVGSVALLALASVSTLGAWIIALQMLPVPPLVFFELRALRESHSETSTRGG